jgi:hypothetical protein
MDADPLQMTYGIPGAVRLHPARRHCRTYQAPGIQAGEERAVIAARRTAITAILAIPLLVVVRWEVRTNGYRRIHERRSQGASRLDLGSAREA